MSFLKFPGVQKVSNALLLNLLLVQQSSLGSMPQKCYKQVVSFYLFSPLLFPQALISKGGLFSTPVSGVPYKPPAVTVESAEPRLSNTLSTLS
ncbi:BgtTE-56114 [Blumeria graminis f. sp. tritici]|uniref:BgtTE-56114 n=1 Tax=Blumeria graminis f. sp. tritici TaxID=62690 RepID=A0A9X9QFZ2_BLUGR|nr:BgtTE-56114 [Blumeria graminis f. sp. tritici]